MELKGSEEVVQGDSAVGLGPAEDPVSVAAELRDSALDRDSVLDCVVGLDCDRTVVWIWSWGQTVGVR